jgi:hypothetical protein
MVIHVADVDPLFALVTDFGIAAQIIPCGVKKGNSGMAMHVADVDPLKALITDNTLGNQIVPCRNKQGRQVVGFCQALFAKTSEPEAHTILVCDSLEKAGSTFVSSHELFLGHWQSDECSFVEWFIRAAAPLKERTGCVPVLITGLSASDDLTAAVFESKHQLGEPVLVRMLLDDIESSTKLMQSLVSDVDTTSNLPSWWPLFQASSYTSLEEWQQLANLLGDYWRYVCVAIDPFASLEVREFLRWQTVVVQIPIGEQEGIGDTMQIPAGMLSAFPDGTEYVLSKYLASLPSDKKDILIVLGPSKEEWSCDYNTKRIVAIKQLMGHHDINI